MQCNWIDRCTLPAAREAGMKSRRHESSSLGQQARLAGASAGLAVLTLFYFSAFFREKASILSCCCKFYLSNNSYIID
jgi:hypothetical protein